VLLLGAWALAAADRPVKAGGKTKIRIGTFDSRAVAVAYVRSDIHQRYLKGLMAERDKAQKAGNTKRVKELEAKGKAMQQRVHRQGFGHARIDDILEHLRKEIPGIARKAGVDVVAEETLYHDSSVEIVDITDFMIEPFNPSKKTRNIIKDLLKHPPLKDEQLEKLHDH
ncbi:MAG: hypothetical protein JSV03_01915, partial [Planctomycetota bacterium]